MIRVNLLPAVKRKRSRPSASASPINKAVVVLAAGALSLVALAGTGFYILDMMQNEALALRAEAGKNKARAEEIRKLIDEEALQARLRKVDELKKAIEKLEAQRRTPVFVMFELANVLSTGKLPDIDEEKQRKIEATDPQAKLNPTWDATSVWVTGLEEKAGDIKINGAARDPADLDEFIKRLRSSVRFSSVSHAGFVAKTGTGKAKDEAQGRQYTFTIDATVSFWD
jgi:Tfp pilus assembly protein PilN